MVGKCDNKKCKRVFNLCKKGKCPVCKIGTIINLYPVRKDKKLSYYLELMK